MHSSLGDLNVANKQIYFIYNNVTLAIGPDCELVAQLFFPSKNIFKILIEFSMTKNIQYFLDLRSKKFQIMFIKS